MYSPEMMKPPAGYEYGRMFDNLTEADYELLQNPFFQEMLEFLIGSFVISSGRQYGQFCDMVPLAAMWQESGKPVDWAILNPNPDQDPEADDIAKRAIDLISRLKLPDDHTQAPNNVEGLRPGVLVFWWRMLVDAFQWRYDSEYQLPADELAIKKRFAECGVPLGSSSNTTEERQGMNAAIGYLRDDEAMRTASVDELIMKSIKPHLEVALHWQVNPRPIRNRSKGGDVHAELWREGMVRALETPENERTPYDHLLARTSYLLDFFVDMHPDEFEDPVMADARELYDEVVELYNKNTVEHNERLDRLNEKNIKEGLDVIPKKAQIVNLHTNAEKKDPADMPRHEIFSALGATVLNRMPLSA